MHFRPIDFFGYPCPATTTASARYIAAGQVPRIKTSQLEFYIICKREAMEYDTKHTRNSMGQTLHETHPSLGVLVCEPPYILSEALIAILDK